MMLYSCFRFVIYVYKHIVKVIYYISERIPGPRFRYRVYRMAGVCHAPTSPPAYFLCDGFDRSSYRCGSDENYGQTRDEGDVYGKFFGTCLVRTNLFNDEKEKKY